MILFICVDERLGMCFNHRRQSRDRAVVEKMIEVAKGRCIWMEPYSVSLFPETPQITSDDNFLQKASLGDYCFVERLDITRCLNRAEKIILFHWNRKYPADLYFPKSVLADEWRMVEAFDFVGTAHDKITMKVYEH